MCRFDFGIKGYSREWPEKPAEYNIFVTTGVNLTKIRSLMYLGLETYCLGFRVKGLGHSSNDLKIQVNTIFQKPVKGISPNFGHRCTSVCRCADKILGSKVKVTVGNDPKNLWTPYLENQWREFHPILVTDVVRFVDVLIRFWGQKVKGQGHSRRKHNRWRLPVE